MTFYLYELINNDNNLYLYLYFILKFYIFYIISKTLHQHFIYFKDNNQLKFIYHIMLKQISCIIYLLYKYNKFSK